MGTACVGHACLLLHALACLAGLGGVTAQPVADPAADNPNVESAHLYGNINKYAYYFTDLMIGSPPQRTSVIVDTGSRLVGFPCRGCDHCGDHLDPAFDFQSSQSARWLQCGIDCQTGCDAEGGHCQYQETYSEGSTIAGRWFDDLVMLDNVFHTNPPVHARMGCHMNENKLFYTQRANGIMGLAPSSETTMDPGDNRTRPTILQDLFRDKQHVSSAIFSICLATWGGRLTVGGYNTSYQRPSTLQWMPMNPSHYYFVFPEGLYQNALPGFQQNRASDFGIAIIDSGTTYTYFPPPVYHSLTAEMGAYCDANGGCGATRAGDECWRLTDPSSEPTSFPTLLMKFRGGSVISWAATDYLHQRGEQGVWCQTFMKNNLNQTVLGISWMLHKDVIFDLQQNRLGVAEADCPEHRTETELQQKDSLGPAAEAVENLAAAKSGRVFLVIGCLTLVAGLASACWSARAASSAHRRRNGAVLPDEVTTKLRRGSAEDIVRLD